jgi:rare lipoprotein A (peptidoglycan hydrolase)
MRRLIAALALCVLCLLNIPVRAEECVASVHAVGDSSAETKTAGGIPLNDNDMTAAHKTLPLGSEVKIANKKNGHAVTVTITDQGPYIKGRAEECVASMYAVGDPSQPGTKTASGIPLNDNDMTAAHKSLPFGSTVKVTNKKNGHAVTVTITDRGPYVKAAALI